MTDPGSQQTGFDYLRGALALGVGAVAPVTSAARQAVLEYVSGPHNGRPGP